MFQLATVWRRLRHHRVAHPRRAPPSTAGRLDLSSAKGVTSPAWRRRAARTGLSLQATHQILTRPRFTSPRTPPAAFIERLETELAGVHPDHCLTETRRAQPSRAPTLTHTDDWRARPRRVEGIGVRSSARADDRAVPRTTNRSARSAPAQRVSPAPGAAERPRGLRDGCFHTATWRCGRGRPIQSSTARRVIISVG